MRNPIDELIATILDAAAIERQRELLQQLEED